MTAYTQRHFQDLAALLAAEREQNGPSPALNRITAAITELFANDSPAFRRDLFGRAARGKVPATARPRRRSDRSEAPESGPGGNLGHGYYEHPEDISGWTPPVIIQRLDGTTRPAQPGAA
jgi:hypothetical protein